MTQGNKFNLGTYLRKVLKENIHEGRNREILQILDGEFKNKLNVSDYPILDFLTAKEIEHQEDDQKRAEPESMTSRLLSAMEATLNEKPLNMEVPSITPKTEDSIRSKARVERFDTTSKLLRLRLEKGKPVGPHVRQMIELFAKLEELGSPVSQSAANDMILYSLHEGFNLFKMEYAMNGWNKPLEELDAMLQAAERLTMDLEPKNKILVAQENKRQKKKPALKGKGKRIAKPQNKGIQSTSRCFYCSGIGHWKRNCPKFLEDKKNGTVASNSGINS